MGLSMTLSRVWYFHSPELKKELEEIVRKMLREKVSKEFNFRNLSTVVEDVVYWNKANMIHHWFVENIQRGVDDCGTYEVSFETLKNIKSIIEEVLKDHTKAKVMLPTMDGFYFGSVEYDDYYFEELEYTSKELEKIIKEEEEIRFAVNATGITMYYEYRSSW